MTTNRVDGRCEPPTTPVGLSCTDTEPMPSSVESGAGPIVKARSLGTRRRADFTIDGDSNASDSKSLQTKAYGAMQTRIQDAKNKKEEARATRDKTKATSKGPTNKHVNPRCLPLTSGDARAPSFPPWECHPLGPGRAGWPVHARATAAVAAMRYTYVY